MTPQMMLQQAMSLHQSGRLDEAERLYRQVLEGDPGSYPALHLMGLLRLMQGRTPEALRFMEAALTVQPGAPDTLANYGIALSGAGRQQEALAALEAAVRARPNDSQARSNLGAVKDKLDMLEAALADFRQAAVLDPNNSDARNNLGLTLHRLNRFEEALDSFNALLALKPDYVEGRNNRGLSLRELERHTQALVDFDAVIAAMPGHVAAWVNRASCLWSLEQVDAALESYGRALALAPGTVAALESRANLYWTRCQALAPAIADLEAALRIAPDLPFAAGDLLQLKMHAGDWRDFSGQKARLDDGVRAGKPVVQPFVYQALSASPADLLQCARIFVARKCPAQAPPIAAPHVRRDGRIRIGYVCGEFRAQATMYLAAGLFERHDRSRFEICAFDNGRDDHSPTRARVAAAFDKFHVIAGLTDREAVACIQADDVDILVNLNGHFGKMRMAVFANRAAPIQVNYLGFPGTLGADCMDYILADAVLVPDGEQKFYAEKVVTLPDSYQINDARRPPAGITTRAVHGLPENAFVFCHFNYGYKITPDLFAAWMRILKQADGSVLWLLAGDPLFARNLKAEAAQRGVDPARLIFAPPLDHQPHLARLALGDLFLDSLISNAHTTASDALWAGLPLLTCRGTAFAGRVGASLLCAVGLPELVRENLADYEAAALKLARAPALLSQYRDRLQAARSSAPLFDTARTTRHIEAAYEEMMAVWQRGEAPRGFAVAPH